jgi:putative PIG3 family NAD(P)H quinone oxidoreductase
MRVVRVARAGGPEVLELAERPRPVPGPAQLLVKVAASGLNRADLLQRRGMYPAPPGWPDDVPGLEYAGTVEAVGPETRLFGVGDRVMGIVGGGGYSDAVVVHEREAVRVPSGMDLLDAGAVPEAFMTAFDALFSQARLSAGETVLVHAVGSGVGTAALQLARAAGARTIGTSRTAEKLVRAQELGLDAGVLAGDDWPAAVRKAAGGGQRPTSANGRVDLILDLVGAPYAAGNLEVIGERGRWIVVGVTGGATTTFDFRALMSRRASITGTVLRARPAEEKMALAREFEARVLPLLERRLLRPVVDDVFAPSEVGEAHRRMEENRSFGKLLIDWRR